MPATGAGLEQAISSLRARGYLSHGLLSPEEGETFEWLDELGGEGQFQSSRAGHSTSRIDSLFTTLLDRERANPGADDADLVAAVGDDEQFALASAMIADQFGFNVRIVLGARLTSEEPDLSVCTDGVCTGGDMAAWIEVEDGTSGEWVAIDVTPQHTNAVHVDTQQQTDPKNNTEVDPDRAEVVPPPDANQGDGSKEGTDQQGSQGSPLRLSEPVRMGGVFLSAAMLLALPCAAILVRKWLRRRGRRLATYPAVRVVGAWDEFLDLARDVDMPISPQKTRMEIVRDVAPGHPQAEALAALADSAVFSPAYVSPDHAVYAWNLVHAEEKLLRHPENWWKRVRSWLSLRSLYRERATSVMQKRGRQRRVTSARHKTVRISHTTGLLASTSTRGS